MSKRVKNWVLEPEPIDIPISIFSADLSGLESITKYLKEYLNMSYSDIAKTLNRDARTIWGTYSRSRLKSVSTIFSSNVCESVPSFLFQNRNLGVLEILTFYLREEYGLRYCQIARKLSRDDRTIRTAFFRARKKLRA